MPERAPLIDVYQLPTHRGYGIRVGGVVVTVAWRIAASSGSTNLAVLEGIARFVERRLYPVANIEGTD